MKILWKVIILSIAVGLVLAIIGFFTGASRTLYLDRRGVHVSGSGISHITESDMESFKNIYIDAGFSDVVFVISDHYGIELYGNNMEWRWTLENDALGITYESSTRFQILHIDFISKERNYAKIFIPQDSQLETVTIKTGSGDISLADLQADNLDISTSSASFSNAAFSWIFSA